MLDYAHRLIECGRQLGRMTDFAKIAIEDVVPSVGDKRIA